MDFSDSEPLNEPIAPEGPLHPVHTAWWLLLGGQVSGIVASHYVGPVAFLPWVFIATLSVTIIVAVLGRSGSRWQFCCIVGGLCLGGLQHYNTWWKMPHDDLRHLLNSDRPRLVTIRGWVVNRELIQQPSLYTTNQSESFARIVIESDAISGENSSRKCSGKILLETSAELGQAVGVGHPCQVTGWLESLPVAMNPGAESSSDYWKSQGIIAIIHGKSHAQFTPDTSRQPIYWRTIRERIRLYCRSALRESLDENTAGLVEALVLGIRESVTERDKLAFKETGTLHLLAISGLHLQVVAMFVMSLAGRLKCNLRVASLLVILSSLVYAMLVTGGASVARAVCMASIVAIATIRCRGGQFWHRLCLAAAVVLWIRPLYLFDAGAQLSFLGTAGIYIASVGCQKGLATLGLRERRNLIEVVWQLHYLPAFFEDRDRKATDWRYRIFKCVWVSLQFVGYLLKLLFQAMLISTTVWLITAILVAFHFGMLNAIAILANLPLVPMTSLALLAGISGLVVHAIGCTFMANFAVMLSGKLMSYSVAILQLTTDWGFRPWSIKHFDCISVTGFYLLLFFALFKIGRMTSITKKSALLTTPVIWLIVVPSVVFQAQKQTVEQLQLEMLSVNHGLSIIVQWPDGENWLYDCGEMSRPKVGSLVVAPALEARSVTHLDKLFLSHADADHFNGVPDLIASGITIHEVITTSQFIQSRQPDAVALRHLFTKKGIPVRTLDAGSVLKQMAEGSAKIVFPNRSVPIARADNASSLVVEIEAFGINCLLTGDLENQGLLELAMCYESGLRDRLDCDVLMAPHHGGVSSNPPWFYEKLQPQLVMSSQGRSRFGIAAGLQSRIEKYCPESPLLVTARDGAIRLLWRPDGLIYETYSSGNGRPIALSRRNPVLKRSGSRPTEFVFNP